MSGGGGSTTQTVQNYSPEEVARRLRVFDEAERIYGQTRGNYSQYPGLGPVAPAQETLQAEDVLRGIAPAQINRVADLNRAVSFGLGDVLYAESNPYLRSSINAAIRPLREEMVNPGGVLSQIRRGATDAGQYGGSRQGIAEGIAVGKYLQSVGDTAAKMASEGYGRGLDVFSRTMAFTPSSMQAMSIPAQTLATVGASVEGRAADQLAHEEARRLWELNAPWTPLQNYANIVFGGGSSGQTITGRGSGMTAGQRLAGAALGGLGAYQLAAGIGSGAAAGSAAAAIGAAAPWIGGIIALASLFG